MSKRSSVNFINFHNVPENELVLSIYHAGVDEFVELSLFTEHVYYFSSF